MAEKSRPPQRPLDDVVKKQFFLGFASQTGFQIFTTDRQELSLLQTLCGSQSFLVIFQTVLTKTVPIFQYKRRFARNDDLYSPLNDDEERSGVIAGIEEYPILLILERVHVVADGVALLVGEKVEQG